MSTRLQRLIEQHDGETQGYPPHIYSNPTDKALLVAEIKTLREAGVAAYVAGDCRCGPEPGVVPPKSFVCARCRLGDALGLRDGAS